MRGPCVCLAALLLLVGSGALLGGDGEKDLKKLQGTWQFTAHSMGGKETPKVELAKMKITFTGNKWSVTEDGKVIQAGTHKLDATKKPGQVDAPVTEGEGKGATMLGIYEFKGDTMKVCFDPQGKERPTNFTPKEGHFVATIERDKKKS
jgi:uncharacterized protein (TIGR03067 family)